MVWNPGRQLFGGRYIIEKKLGEGGMGITYLAKNLQGELRVIKTLSETILNNRDLKKHLTKIKQDFKEEALRLALCRHPYIVKIETVFDEGDLPCMAMEYIKGEDLNKLITKKGALPEAEALQYIQQIGEALKLVHEKGLLHRDLKPGNIMLRADKPEVVLIDFGLARQFIPDKVLHHTEAFTPGYAPPEQYVNEAERGEYIDVYALAATLYSLLTGQTPMQVPARLLNDRLKPPKYFKPTVSDRVNKAIMKGMELNYELRPQSVQEWLSLFALLKPDNWECVHVIPGISGSIALSPRGDIIASLAGDVIHLLSVTTGQVIRSLLGHSDSIDYIAFSSDGQMLASASCDNTIKLWDVVTGREIRTITCGSDVSKSFGLSSVMQILGRFFTYIDTIKDTIKILDMATGKEICILTGDWCVVAVSRDGKMLASCDRNGTMQLWEVPTGKKIRTFIDNIPAYAMSVVFSSDGKILARGGWNGTIKLWEVATGKEIRTFTGHSNSIDSVAFSRDGRMLASSSGDDGTIKLWNVATEKEIRTFTGNPTGCYSFSRKGYLTISNDGKILASGSNETIRLWEVGTGKEIRTLTNHSNSIDFVALSHDGRMLASCHYRGNIKLWEVATGREIRTFDSHLYLLKSVAFSRDGQMLVSLDSGDIHLWDVATERKIRGLGWFMDSFSSVAFSNDGKIVAGGGSKTIKLWDVATGKKIRTFNGHSSLIDHVAFSHDGRMLAGGSSWDGTIKLWDMATGREIHSLTVHSGYFRNSFAFSSDGQMMLASSQGTVIKLWEVATGREVCTLSHFSSVTSFAMSHNGNWLAAGDESGNIKIWRRS